MAIVCLGFYSPAFPSVQILYVHEEATSPVGMRITQLMRNYRSFQRMHGFNLVQVRRNRFFDCSVLSKCLHRRGRKVYDDVICVISTALRPRIQVWLGLLLPSSSASNAPLESPRTANESGLYSVSSEQADRAPKMTKQPRPVELCVQGTDSNNQGLPARVPRKSSALFSSSCPFVNRHALH